jgi:allophanate hydrolase subunit 1
MHNFPRPTTPTVSSPRTPVPGACPECGAQQLSRYRVMSEGGWWLVVKCGSCLHSVSREPGPLLGAFVPLGAP